jgi:hypothetical protein
MNNYCCEKFKNGVEGEDKLFLWIDSEKKYDIDSYEIKDSYYMDYCPFCGAKL